MARAGVTTSLTTSYTTLFEAGAANDGVPPLEITLKCVTPPSGANIDVRISPTHANVLSSVPAPAADTIRMDGDWNELAIFDAAGIQKVEAKLSTGSASHELRWAITVSK
jgi:hypothetical protein